MSFDNLTGYISLSILYYITISHSVHRSCQYQRVCKISSHYSTQFNRWDHFLSKYSPQFKRVRPFSLFQNLVLGKASTDDKCHFTIVSLFSEFHPRQKLNQSQMSFDNLIDYILSISVSMLYFITISHSVQEIAPLSLFRNLELGKTSTDVKCHFAISWA